MLYDIDCAWTLVAGPQVEPVSLQELKDQIGITDSDSDALLYGFIRTAREEAEKHLGWGLYTQTWLQVQSDFATVNPLFMAHPLQNDSGATPSTAVVVKYYDTAGTLQTLATTVYGVDVNRRPGTVVLKPDQTWPSLQSSKRNGRVEITYVVGHTTIEDIPERIKQGIKVYAAGLDRDRGQPGAAETALRAAQSLWDDRVYWLPPHWC